MASEELTATLTELIQSWGAAKVGIALAVAENSAQAAEVERVQRVQQDTLVALFDGNEQVTDWTPFADGKVSLPGEWLKSRQLRYRAHDVDWLVHGLQMRTRDGKPLRASTSVQEHIVRSYAITWRTVW